MVKTGKAQTYLLIVLVLGGLALFYRLGARDMWGRLESEAAVCARNMIQTGEYSVPVLMEKPFVDNRPPGSFWLVAGSFKLTGRQDEWSARLPSALAAALCLLLVYLMGRQARGPTTGLFAVLILLGTVFFLWIGRMSQQDMLLTLGTTAGYFTFQCLLDCGSRSRSLLLALGFQVACGFGVLVKGPAAVLNLLPLGVYVLYSRRWRDVKWTALLLTLPVGVAVAGTWYLNIWFAHPEHRDILVGRFTNQAHIHVEPFYGILLMLPGILGPVLLMLPVLVSGWWRADRTERRGPLGLYVIGFVGLVALYSFFPSKRPHYLLPALPLVALGLGYVIDRYRYDLRPLLVWTGLGLVVLTPILAAGWLVAVPTVADALEMPREAVGYGSPIRAAVLTLALASLATWVFVSHLRGHRDRTWRLSMVCWVLGLTFLMGEVIPGLNCLKSFRPFAARVGEIVPADAPLASVSSDAGLEYYAGRRVRLLKGRGLKHLSDPDAFLIVIGDGIEAVPEDRRRILYTEPGSRYRRASYLLRGVATEDSSVPAPE